MRIEGKNSVLENLKNGTTFNKIMIDKRANDSAIQSIVKLSRERNIRLDFVDNEIIKKNSVTKAAQGVIAEIVDFEYCDLQDIIDKGNGKPFVLILDQLSDAHNFGALIRSAECFGVDGIVISERRSVSVNEIVTKTSAGAVSKMLIARENNIKNAITKLKKNGVWVYALEVDGKDITKTSLTGGIALVVGSEGFGVSQSVKNACDEVLSISMKGEINSLNASVAGAIAMWEVSKQQ